MDEDYIMGPLDMLTGRDFAIAVAAAGGAKVLGKVAEHFVGSSMPVVSQYASLGLGVAASGVLLIKPEYRPAGIAALIMTGLANLDHIVGMIFPPTLPVSGTYAMDQLGNVYDTSQLAGAYAMDQLAGNEAIEAMSQVPQDMELLNGGEDYDGDEVFQILNAPTVASSYGKTYQ